MSNVTLSDLLNWIRENAMLLLVTGATGKVGSNLIAHILAEPHWSGARIRALCHNRLFPQTDRVEVVNARSGEAPR